MFQGLFSCCCFHESRFGSEMIDQFINFVIRPPRYQFHAIVFLLFIFFYFFRRCSSSLVNVKSLGLLGQPVMCFVKFVCIFKRKNA